MNYEALARVVMRSATALASSFALVGVAASASAQSAHIEIGPNLRASSNATRGNRNEPWIAVSPRNPDFLIGVSQIGPSGSPLECTTTISRNGGRTWREIRLPGQETGCFDPMVLATSEGRVYVMHAMILQGESAALARAAALASSRPRRLPDRTIRVWTTEDNGRTWVGPTDLDCPLAPDHPRMVVDESGGPFHGRLYIAWNEGRDTLLRDKFHVFLHYSDDGAKTFSEPILVTSAFGGKLVTTEPVVLSDGTLLFTYYQFHNPTGSKGDELKPLYVMHSTDGGQTFAPPERAIEFGSSAWSHLARDFVYAYALPLVAADTSPTSPYRDRVYVVWDDVRAGTSDIWLSWSSDGASTWAEPVRVNDNARSDVSGPPDYRMTPVVAVNNSGVVGVAWYDRRDDPSRRCWHQYFTASLDGGRTFLPNVAVSTAPSCPQRDLAPSVYVSNLADVSDETQPSANEISRMNEGWERHALERDAAIESSLREEYGPRAPRIRLGFDTGRNVWPGHYTGLAADAAGAFHPLWADRRNGPQQLFTARLVISADRADPVPPTREMDLSDGVALIAGPSWFNEADGTATFEIQARNVSESTIYAPLTIHVTDITESDAGPTAEFVAPDASSTGVGTSWDLSDHMGTKRRLLPGDVTAATTITVRVRVETGLDAVFGFRVRGHVAIADRDR